jgi:hypothetical protein
VLVAINGNLDAARACQGLVLDGQSLGIHDLLPGHTFESGKHAAIVVFVAPHFNVTLEKREPSMKPVRGLWLNRDVRRQSW